MRLHFQCSLILIYTVHKRYYLHFSGSNTVKVVSMVKCISMSQEDKLLEDARTLLRLLKDDEDSLNDAGKKLVKQQRDYARQVFVYEVDGWTPFHAFVLKGARKMVKHCLRAGVDVNLTMGAPDGLPGCCSALHLAALRGDVSIINILVQYGAEINLKDDSNKSPVMYAASANNTLAVKTLKRAGADMRGCEERTDDMTSSRMMCFLPFVCAGVRR